MTIPGSIVHPNKLLFIEGVKIVFDTWTALCLAVEQQWGGPSSKEKAIWLADTIVEHFEDEGKRVEQEDLECILLDVMTREFNVILEDESEREVAKMLYDLYHQCISGRTHLLESLRERKRKYLASNVTLSCHTTELPGSDCDDDAEIHSDEIEEGLSCGEESEEERM